MSCDSSSSSTAFWISMWVLIIIFFILAVACRSVVLVVLVLVIALGLGMGQCLFQNSKKNISEEVIVVDKKNENEKHFGEGHEIQNDSLSLGEKEALINKVARSEYDSDQMFYPTGTNVAGACCASRGNTTNDGWLAGYEVEPWQDSERALEKLAVDAYQEAEHETEPSLLPKKCSTDPLPCKMRVGWQSSFTNCPSTFIEAPSCKVYKRDDRLWNRRLDDIIQERASLSGEIWDPYKHFHSRQNFAQFISEDLVHRKDYHMRPIEDLEESYCFAKKPENICE